MRVYYLYLELCMMGRVCISAALVLKAEIQVMQSTVRDHDQRRRYN